jgi:hypothetical protein
MEPGGQAAQRYRSSPGGDSRAQNDDPRWAVIKTIVGERGERFEFNDSASRLGGGLIYLDTSKWGTECSVTLHRGIKDLDAIGKSTVEIVNLNDARHFAAIFGKGRVGADTVGLSSAYTRSLRSTVLTLTLSRQEAIEEDENPNPFVRKR